MNSEKIRFCEQFETYDEMVTYVTQRVHLGLLEEGGKGLRSAIHRWLSEAIQIGIKQAENEKR